MKHALKLFLVATGLILMHTDRVIANCTARFTQIPDFVVNGEGTCNHDGNPATEVTVPGLTDLLQVTVEAGAGCDPIANNCKVIITATWAGGSEMTTKGPFTAQQQADGDGWPHNV
ncbi:MAG: hypothetical protein MI923_23550 [Phycisphaerales bacterium]|nr:hypothetical protein [Phycisphaerales bacterium]